MTRSFARAALGALLLALAPLAGAAQDPKAPKEPKGEKALTIRWFGQSFFQFEDSAGRLFAIDPHGIPAFGRVPVRADFVLLSHSHDDHSLIEMIDSGTKDARIKDADVYRGVVENKTGKQDWKLHDEKRGPTKFRNVATYHDTTNGMQRGKNSAWVIDVDGLTVCHLGDLGHELSDLQVKGIGKIDVLMVPVGGIYTINGEQAAAVVKKLKPRLYVIPMHYGVPGYDDLTGPEEFLSEFKKDQVKRTLSTNELSIPLDAKADAPTVLLMGWKKAEPKELKKP
jgi:L-ascorbate metabolism protein UlaG (beta-lactamase superfamily)